MASLLAVATAARSSPSAERGIAEPLGLEPGRAAPLEAAERRRQECLPLVERAARSHGVAPALVEALIAAESCFQPRARSHAGACGLMQLMPRTASLHGLSDPFDPEANVDAGTRHLAQLLDAFGGDWRLAVAAYNAGTGAVKRARGVPLIGETRRHVAKVERYLASLGALPLERARLPPGPPPAPIVMLLDERGHLFLTNVPADDEAAP